MATDFPAGDEMMHSSKRFGWSTRIIFLLVSISIGFCLVECVVRFSGINDNFTRRIFSKNLLQPSPSEVLVYEPKPEGYSMIDGVENRISKQGLRDREFAVPKPDQVFRVIALGDSITYGLGVKSEETFSKVLEKRLNQNPEMTQKTEVLNLGVNGYKTLQEIERLRLVGLPFQPDVVILAYNLNDPGDFSRELPYFRSWQSRQWNKAAISLPKRLLSFFANYSDLFFMLEYRTLKWKLEGMLKAESVPNVPNRYDGYFHLYRDKSTLDKLQNAFHTLADMAETHNFRVVHLVFPLLIDFDDYRWESLHTLVLEMGQQQGFLTHDLLTDFRLRGLKPKDLQRRDDDFEHPNPEGHALVAEILEKLIIEMMTLTANPDKPELQVYPLVKQVEN